MSITHTNLDTPVVAFQLKGTMLAITIFEITHLDLQILEQQLIKKINEAPEFFKSIPMVLAFSDQLKVTNEQFLSVINLLKQHNIQLLALRTQDELLIAMAKPLDLILLPSNGAREKLIEIAVNRPTPLEPTIIDSQEQEQQNSDKVSETEQSIKINKTLSDSSQSEEANTEIKIALSEETKNEESKEIIPTVAIEQPSKIINSVVRSGQQITVNSNVDLIITASVSPGAELMANGNIHIYGAMRGRAMAGHFGNKEARIFCYKLTAELIAIAGVMMNEEELRRHPLWGKPAQISLNMDQLTIEPL